MPTSTAALGASSVTSTCCTYRGRCFTRGRRHRRRRRCRLDEELIAGLACFDGFGLCGGWLGSAGTNRPATRGPSGRPVFAGVGDVACCQRPPWIRTPSSSAKSMARWLCAWVCCTVLGCAASTTRRTLSGVPGGACRGPSASSAPRPCAAAVATSGGAWARARPNRVWLGTRCASRIDIDNKDLPPPSDEEKLKIARRVHYLFAEFGRFTTSSGTRSSPRKRLIGAACPHTFRIVNPDTV